MSEENKETENTETEENITEAVDVKSVIKSLVDLDWEKNQGKAAELLKGLAHAEDAESDKFMAKLSAAASKIGAGMNESDTTKTRFNVITDRANDLV